MQINDTRERIIRTGAEIIARQGFASTGINAVLKAAGTPKGSFYHYFTSKDGFGLAVIAAYAEDHNAQLAATLNDASRPPLQRLHAYFSAGVNDMNSSRCACGCLIGNLGQELAAHNESFRARLDEIFITWEKQIAACIAAAREAGEVHNDIDPDEVGRFILAGWEGAILRSKVDQSTGPMERFARVLFQQVLRRH